MSTFVSEEALKDELLKRNSSLVFQLHRGLPTKEENTRYLIADKAAAQVAGKSYWQVMQDIRNREQLRIVLDRVDPSQNYYLSSEELDTLIK